jgi:hypothetical protein
MKALVYYGDHDIKYEEKPKPEILKPTDAIVKIVKLPSVEPIWEFTKEKTLK